MLPRVVREVWDPHAHMAVFRMETSKDLPYRTGNSAQCYRAVWMGGELGGEWVHVYTYEYIVHLQPSLHC